MISETDRLDMLRALGAEQFQTSHADSLWATLEGEFNEPALTGIPTAGEITWIECRSSDVDLHGIVKGSKIIKKSDGETWFAKRFEPSRSSGFTIIRLGK